VKTAIDDMPMVSASRLRAQGVIRAEDATAAVAFGDAEFTVSLSLVRFPNGGSWSFFICACGRRCRTLRLFDGELGCKGCLERRGFRYRVLSLPEYERAKRRIPKLRAMLESETPLRRKPHLLWSKLERRKRLEAALRKAELLVGYTDFVKLKEAKRAPAGEGS
jgi:hypothetical protein